MPHPGPETRAGLAGAVATVRALRAEGGCPWDKEQTHASLRPYLLEEAYESLEALDALAAAPGPDTRAALKEELGDLLLQILLHAEISRQEGGFDIEELASELSRKLTRRHPHVFGGEKLGSSEQVLGAWNEIKAKERKRESALEGIPAALPALARALKLIERVSRVGFQWPDLSGPMEKLREELAELEQALREADAQAPESLSRERRLPESSLRKIEAELGDVLFGLANIAYFLRLNPEDALRSMLARFERRFRHVEQGAAALGRTLPEMSLEEMDRLWAEAKDREK